jgi:hypothetical protein
VSPHDMPGAGDVATWPKCAGHALDPRTEPDDDTLTADEARGIAEDEAETSQPIYRTPASADGILDAAEAAAKAYQERTGCTLADMYAFEAGHVRGLLRRELHRAAALERELLRELQLALNETCNSYHDAGHAKRVKETFGLVMEGGL